jgi:hypothetical protein
MIWPVELTGLWSCGKTAVVTNKRTPRMEIVGFIACYCIKLIFSVDKCYGESVVFIPFFGEPIINLLMSGMDENILPDFGIILLL